MAVHEVEVKILEVNPRKIRRLLVENSAKEVKKVFQRNVIYHNKHTKLKGVVVRLRQEDKNTWFTVKSPVKFVNGHKTRWEHEVKVPDFKAAERMISLMGFKKYAVTEAKREYYKLDDCSVEIINMPKVPIFIEIEGTKKNISKVATKLGHSEKDYFTKFVLDHYKIKSKFLEF